MAVKVVTDSANDIPSDIVEELGITVVPAYVRFGNTDYKDGVELTTDQFFDRLLNGPDFPATSQPSVGDFSEVYADVADGADGIVSVHISGKLSGTVNSAQQGAGVADAGCPIEVVDTLQASMGSGLATIAAAKAARDGASFHEVAAVANAAARKCQCVCLLDTLEFLIKGGRIGKAQGMIGSLLKIKPMIILRDGEVDNFAKERTRRKAVSRLQRGGGGIRLRRILGRHVQHIQRRSRAAGRNPEPCRLRRHHNSPLRPRPRHPRRPQRPRHIPPQRVRP